MSHIRTPVMPMKPTQSGSNEAPRPAATQAKTASVGAALADPDGDTRGTTRGGQWKEGTPLVAAECSFRRASQTRETLSVESHVSRFGRSSFTISHVFRDAPGEIAAESKETRIWARNDGDARSLKSVPIPDDVRRRLAG
jgi:Thioesterase superfamily